MSCTRGVRATSQRSFSVSCETQSTEMDAQDIPQDDPCLESVAQDDDVPHEDNVAPEEPKPKRSVSEAQLRALAEGRKKAIESRKAASVIKSAKVLAKQNAFEERMEQTEQALKTIRQLRKPAQEPVEKAPVAEVKPIETKPNPRDEYYSYKLRLLREREEAERQQQDWMRSYQRAPVQQHAADIARQSLYDRANKAMLARAYRELFPDD